METEKKFRAEIGYNHLDLMVLIGLPFLYFYLLNKFNHNELISVFQDGFHMVELISLHLLFIFCLLDRREIWKTKRTWSNRKTKKIEIPYNQIISYKIRYENLELNTKKGKFQFPTQNFISNPNKVIENLKTDLPKIPFENKLVLSDYYKRIIHILILIFLLSGFIQQIGNLFL